jgi:hypothetical protein
LKTALITPSFAPDFDRCKLLVDSANRFVRGIDQHYLVVDRRDVALFRSLARGRVELLVKEDLLPKGYKPLAGSRRWWRSSRGWPVRGWIVQQVTKLAVSECVDADAYLFADSDVMFVREWDAGQLWQGDDVRLFREQRRGVMLADWRYRAWYRAAAKYTHVLDPNALVGGYIAQLNTLRRDRIADLLHTIEELHQRDWRDALLHTFDFSEYILYGVFAENTCALQGHFADPRPLSLSSWYFDISTPEHVQQFLKHLEPHHVAVHLQSNLKLPPSAYQHLLV